MIVLLSFINSITIILLQFYKGKIKMNKQNKIKLIELYQNTFSNLKEIKTIISNTYYYKSSKGYNEIITNFTFIDINHNNESINVMYQSYSEIHILNQLIELLNLKKTNHTNKIEFCVKLNTKKALLNSYTYYVNYEYINTLIK